MSEVVVLASDWDRGADPVTYYTTNPNGCLDFNSTPNYPRSALTEKRRKTMDDCDTGAKYTVVVCSVSGSQP